MALAALPESMLFIANLSGDRVMQSAESAKYRKFALSCRFKSKAARESAEWLRLAAWWEKLADLHDGLSLISRHAPSTAATD